MGFRRQIGALIGPLRDRVQRHAMVKAAHRAIARFPVRQGVPHPLSGELIVSLTSYPPRYATLPMTLKSILDQGVRPDRTILWIAHADWDALTPEILKLRDFGLSIERCDDVRSYNKIIPALEHYPQAFIITVDDDLYYAPDMVRRLTEGYMSGPPVICAQRAHGIERRGDGRMAPYDTWEGYIAAPGEPPSTNTIFPTGVGGVLYPPGSLAPETTDRALFTRLCPKADDVWLYWMGRRAGSLYRQVGPIFSQIMWDGSQDVSLYSSNAAGGNDEQIAAMEAHFGFA
jgi:hypothetical protein